MIFGVFYDAKGVEFRGFYECEILLRLDFFIL
jgi:hypothetical protein